MQEPAARILRDSKISIHQGYSPENITGKEDVLLAGALCGPDNPEVRRAHDLGVPVSNFARFLGEQFLSDGHTAVVTGSFGKTSTTAMLAFIHLEAGLDPGWLVGGECRALPSAVRLRRGGFWVLEGDEYPSGVEDTSPKFSHYKPEIGVVTSLAHVHPNKIPSLGATARLFAEFVGSVGGTSPVFAANDPVVRRKLLPACRSGSVQTVGFGRSADVRLVGPTCTGAKTSFKLEGVTFSLSTRGRFACTNAALAALAARAWGVSLETSAATLSRFPGVSGRQEVLKESPGLTVVHDMGVHPLSVGKVVNAFARRKGNRRLCILFQPRHTLGDSKAYHRDLARAFSYADLVLLADAINLPLATGTFVFESGMLAQFAPAKLPTVQVGPALSCFARWRDSVEEGDIWLIFTEPLYPEPLTSIRAYIRTAQPDELE